MIVSVRRWTSIALPRLARRAKAGRRLSLAKNMNREKQPGILESYHKMFEHQVNLMFKDDIYK